MNNFGKITSNILGSLWSEQKNTSNSLLENKQILKIVSILQNILEHNKNNKNNIDFPR